MKVNRLILCTALLGLIVSGSASAATISLTPDADTYLRDATVRGALGFMDVRGGNVDFRGYVRFNLSAIPAGATISGATLNLYQVPGASRNDDIVGARIATYGLDNVAGNTAQNWDEATFVIDNKGTEDITTLGGVTDLDDDVAGISEVIGGSAGARTIAVSGGPLASFLQSRYDDGGLATFILSNDDATDRGFGFGTKENADTTKIATLTVEYSAIPEPASLALMGLAVAGLGLSRRR